MAYGFKLPLLYSIQYELSSVAPELWNWTTVYFKLWFTLWYSCGIILEVATSDASCHFSAVSLKKGNGTLWISCGCFYLSLFFLLMWLCISASVAAARVCLPTLRSFSSSMSLLYFCPSLCLMQFAVFVHFRLGDVTNIRSSECPVHGNSLLYCWRSCKLAFICIN